MELMDGTGSGIHVQRHCGLVEIWRKWSGFQESWKSSSLQIRVPRGQRCWSNAIFLMAGGLVPVQTQDRTMGSLNLRLWLFRQLFRNTNGQMIVGFQLTRKF